MKKFMMILACVLVCFLLFTGCTNQNDGGDQDTNWGNSAEIDDTDIAIDTEPGLDTEDNSDDVTLLASRRQNRSHPLYIDVIDVLNKISENVGIRSKTPVSRLLGPHCGTV